MFKVEPEHMLTVPDDPKWWEEKVIKPEEVLAYFELYECRHDKFFDCRRLFCLNPRICEVFAFQLTAKIVSVFKEKGLQAPKWIIGYSTFGHEVAKALGISFISPLSYLQEDFLAIVGESPVLRIETVISSRALLTEYSKIKNILPVMGCCLCSESFSLEGFEIVSLVTI